MGVTIGISHDSAVLLVVSRGESVSVGVGEKAIVNVCVVDVVSGTEVVTDFVGEGVARYGRLDGGDAEAVVLAACFAVENPAEACGAPF